MNNAGVQFVMMAPIINGSTIWGSVNLCYKELDSPFTESDNKAMISISKLLSYGVMKRESTNLLMTSFDTNKAILDSNPFNSIMFDENMNVIGR